jgi:hypothetical protein
MALAGSMALASVAVALFLAVVQTMCLPSAGGQPPLPFRFNALTAQKSSLFVSHSGSLWALKQMDFAAPINQSINVKDRIGSLPTPP